MIVLASRQNTQTIASRGTPAQSISQQTRGRVVSIVPFAVLPASCSPHEHLASNFVSPFIGHSSVFGTIHLPLPSVIHTFRPVDGFHLSPTSLRLAIVTAESHSLIWSCAAHDLSFTPVFRPIQITVRREAQVGTRSRQCESDPQRAHVKV